MIKKLNIVNASGSNTESRICPSEGMSEGVSVNVRPLSEMCLEATYRRLQTVKAARNGINTTPLSRILTGTAAGILFLSALVTTLLEVAALIQITLYLITIAFIIQFDVLRLCGRIFAPQTRFLISACILLSVIGIWARNGNYLIVCGIICASCLFVIWELNNEWLASYNWLCSASVQQSIKLSEDNKAVIAWQQYGLREARTLLYETGQEVDNFILESYCKPLFVLGFSDGYKKTQKAKSKIEKAESKAERLKEANADLKEQLDQLRKESAAAANRLPELERELSEERTASAYYRKLYSDVSNQNKLLMAANEELILALPDPEQIESQTERLAADREAEARKLLLAKSSVRTAANITGLKKYQVEAIRKEMKEQGLLAS